MDGFKRPNQNNQRPPQPIQPVRPPESIAPRMNDIQRPIPQAQPPQQPPVLPSQPRQPQAQIAMPQPIKKAENTPDAAPTVAKKPKKHRFWWILLGIIALLVLGVAIAYNWYQIQLKPVDINDKTKHSIVVTDGMTFNEVTNLLQQQGVIRNKTVTEIYAQLYNKRQVKAGTCVVTKAQAPAEILDKLNAGCHDFKVITFYPGGTIEPSRYKASQSDDKVDKTSANYVLAHAGYSDNEIKEALAADYATKYGDLFEDKPAGTSLEGYLFGETYYIGEDATAKQVIEEALTQMQKNVKQDDLKTKFKAQGLTLYQGLTMASIVERELGCEDKPTLERKQRCYGYQQGIAQVFLKRYKIGMQLGSDVTFIYAADLKGVAPVVDIDSPYNTRKNTGLPPGPIATPGELALKAVADPADADNLYFIAGDDGLIYFAKTDAEHEENIKKYCQELCNVL